MLSNKWYNINADENVKEMIGKEINGKEMVLYEKA